jgi:hypothetical protein
MRFTLRRQAHSMFEYFDIKIYAEIALVTMGTGIC